jgi:hypothetical protein
MGWRFPRGRRVAISRRPDTCEASGWDGAAIGIRLTIQDYSYFVKPATDSLYSDRVAGGSWPSPASGSFEKSEHEGNHYAMTAALRIFAIAVLLGIGIVSLVPIQWRPTVGAPGAVEHFLAYAFSGAVAVFCFRGLISSVTAFFLIALYAAALEFGQFLSPGRHPSLIDFAASSAGCLAGIALLWAWSGVFTRTQNSEALE